MAGTDSLYGKNAIVAAHGNSLRTLTKYIENISDEEIMDDIDVSREKRALTARARFFA